MQSSPSILTSKLKGHPNQLELDPSAFSTAAPEAPAQPLLYALKSGIIGRLSDLVTPVVSRLAKDYLGGETVDDAICVARRLAIQNVSSTLGFWDTTDYTQRNVTDIYSTAVKRLSGSGLDSYVSIKPPALRFDSGAAVELAAIAQSSGVGLHCDSHGPEVVELSHAMLQAMCNRIGPGCLGTTIPGRWSRSLSDADWAVERGFAVRVVKGQWPDPDNPRADMRAGFLNVIEQLAGRARHVAVATHDMTLAAEAIERLRATGTSCELEQIFGLNSSQSLRWASTNGIGLRIYIPFGRGYIPNAMKALKRNPRMAWVMARRLAAGRES
jgi:proline dehydrogenase